MGTQRVQMNVVLLWLVRCARRAGTRDFCPALAALACPVQNIFFLFVHYFRSIFPITRQTRQAVVPGRLSLSMCLGSHFPEKKSIQRLVLISVQLLLKEKKLVNPFFFVLCSRGQASLSSTVHSERAYQMD
jgi:hypothetical protein